MIYHRARTVIPNVLTVLRFLFAPAFSYAVFADRSVTAASLLVVAGVTDLLDGKLARRWNACSEFGSLADPIADKVLLLTLFSVLLSRGWCPPWFLGLLIASNLLQGMGVFLIRSRVAVSFRVSHLGKLNSALQYLFASTTIGFLLFVGDQGVAPHPFLSSTVYAALAISHVLVFLKYFSETRQLVRWDWIRLSSTR